MGQCASERISVTGESANLRIQADILRKSGKYNEALRMYESAIQSNCNNLRAIEGIGTTYMRMQSYREAQYWCTKTLKQHPELDKAHYIQGLLYFFEEEYQNAVEQFLLVNIRSVKIPEFYIWTQYFLAYCYWKLKQIPKALRQVELAIRHFSSQYGSIYLDCHYLKGAIYIENHQINEATEVLMLVIELQEGDYIKLPIKKKQSKLKYIKECFIAIVKSESSQFKFNYITAYLLRALGKQNEAYNRLGKALDIEPDNINALLLDTNLTNGQAQLEQIERILELNPNHKKALFKKAMYLYKNKEYQQSLQFCNKSLEQDQHFTEAHLLLQAIYIALGRGEEIEIDQNCKSPFINIYNFHQIVNEFKLMKIQPKYLNKAQIKLQSVLEQVLIWHEKPTINFDLPDDLPVNYLAIKQILDPYLREFMEFVSEMH